jgi:hypothetical protein
VTKEGIMRIVLPVTFAVLLSQTTFTGQAPANFSGRWVAVEPSSVAGHELHIRQDDDTLTIGQVRIGSRDALEPVRILSEKL